MLRVKRVHRLLVSYTLLVYLLLVLIYQTVGSAGDSAELRELHLGPAVR